MRIFVAGSSGVIGIQLVPLLVADGHEVAAMTRSPEKIDALRALGAEPVLCDAYDKDALVAAVGAFAPDAVLHLLTDLPDAEGDLAALGLANVRMRREGTDNLLAAARAAHATLCARKRVAWRPEGASAAAVAYLEEATLAVGGVVLRYGRFYGPGTWYEDELPAPPRIRMDEAARRTAGALDAPSGIITVAGEL